LGKGLPAFLRNTIFTNGLRDTHFHTVSKNVFPNFIENNYEKTVKVAPARGSWAIS